MAKPDIRASPNRMPGFDRASGIASKPEWTNWKSASAERSLRAFLADTTIAGKSFGLAVKLGKPGKNHCSCLYEREGENQRPVQRKSNRRELLLLLLCF